MTLVTFIFGWLAIFFAASCLHHNFGKSHPETPLRKLHAPAWAIVAALMWLVK